MKVVPVKIRNVNVYPFQDMEELIDYTVDKKKLLLSLNAEIIMRGGRRSGRYNQFQCWVCRWLWSCKSYVP